MTYLHSIILGILEGFTEFLPISSTAHLTLAGSLLHISEGNFFKSFIIIIQLGAILPVLRLYFQKYARNMEVHKRVLAGFVPTALIGFVLYKLIKQFFIGNIPLLLWSLGIGGVIIIVFEWWYARKEKTARADGTTFANITSIEQMPYGKALAIGCYQSIAVIPGVSRSAATILGGLSLGVDKKTIVEYSFLLAVPTMIAATSYDILKSAPSLSGSNLGLLAAGFFTSLIFAQLSITFLLRFIRRYSLSWFGVYRIVVAIVFAVWII